MLIDIIWVDMAFSFLTEGQFHVRRPSVAFVMADAVKRQKRQEALLRLEIFILKLDLFWNVSPSRRAISMSVFVQLAFNRMDSIPWTSQSSAGWLLVAKLRDSWRFFRSLVTFMYLPPSFLYCRLNLCRSEGLRGLIFKSLIFLMGFYKDFWRLIWNGLSELLFASNSDEFSAIPDAFPMGSRRFSMDSKGFLLIWASLWWLFCSTNEISDSLRFLLNVFRDSPGIS